MDASLIRSRLVPQVAAVFALVAIAATARADIFQWEYIDPQIPSLGKQPSTTLAPDGAGVDAVPDAYLVFLNLTMASLTGADLTRALLEGATLTSADLSGADLADADLGGSTLTNADLSGANLAGGYLYSSTLTNADLSGANLADARLNSSTLTNADLSGAVVTGAWFVDTTSRGFTKEQLYSTASYQERSLQRMGLAENDLTGWDFAGQNLAGATLYSSTWTSADLSGANLAGAVLQASTLTSADLRGADLTGTNLIESTLTSADLSGAVVTGASFGDTTSRGFTQEQLYSTANYQEENLQGIGLGGNNLTGWDFAGQDLTGASLQYAMLTNADLSGAVVTGASFWATTSRGFTKEQLYSTASYQEQNLQGIGLGSNDLTGWHFVGHNLAGADLHVSTLASADLSGANLAGANLFASTLTNADLSGANLAGASLFFSTLTNADLSGANLNHSTLNRADLSSADTRGASGLNPTGAITANTILPDGQIDGLELATGQSLVVRDYDGDSPSGPPLPISVDHRFAMSPGGTLRMVFEEDDWDSTISFAAGIPVTLGGTLELTFADNVDFAGQLGRTFNLFDWSGVSPTGTFDVSSPYGWDLASLYTTGDVTLALAGDFNGNGQVEQADLDLVLTNWGTEIADPAAIGWLIDTPSGIVHQAHLDKVLLNWGGHRPQVGPAALAASTAGGVPEPTTFLLIGACVVCCLWLKNKRQTICPTVLLRLAGCVHQICR